MIVFLFIITAVAGISPTVPLKAAVFSLCMRSHLRSMLSIAKELASRPNTEVTFITSSACESFVNELGLGIEIESVATGADNWTQVIEIPSLPDYLISIERPILEHYAQVWELQPHKKPDIIIGDFFMHAALDLGEIFSIQNIVLFPAMQGHRILGGTDLESEYVSFILPFLTLRPSDNVFTRTLNYTIKKIMLFLLNRFFVAKRNDLRAEFNLGPVRKLCGNGLDLPSFTFFESFYGFDEARLTPPYIETVGPLRLKELETQNNEEITDWLKNCNSFIYIAMGTITNITEEQAKIFEQVFASFPYSFLVSSTSFMTELKNVKIFNWVNQIEVLQNPKILAFISHGGLYSIMEAIDCLVPIICLPQGKDHNYICDRAQAIGIGKTFLPKELTFTCLSEAITILLQDSKYKSTLQDIKIIMKMQPGEKRIADAAISFAKIGYQHLVPRWYSLPWYQQNDLDIFIVLVIFAIIIFKGAKTACCKCRHKSKRD